jgi:hypothetical protein
MYTSLRQKETLEELSQMAAILRLSIWYNYEMSFCFECFGDLINFSILEYFSKDANTLMIAIAKKRCEAALVLLAKRANASGQNQVIFLFFLLFLKSRISL